MVGRRSATRPFPSGYCRSSPNTGPSARISSTGTTRTSIPSGSPRDRSTSIVCGQTVSATRNTLASGPFAACTRRSIVMASAAAVGSSSSEALATSMPVRSVTTVW